MGKKLVTWSDVLAGAGLIAPGLVYGLWALIGTRGGAAGLEPSFVFFFLCLLATPFAVLLLGLMGRLVVRYLDAGEGGPADRRGSRQALSKAGRAG